MAARKQHHPHSHSQNHHHHHHHHNHNQAPAQVSPPSSAPPFSPKLQPPDRRLSPPPPQQQQQQQRALTSPLSAPSSLSLYTSSPAAASNDVYEALSAHYLFAEAPPQAIKSLADGMHIRFSVPGDVVISEGDRGRAMFLIVRGECRVQKSAGDVVLAMLKAGQFFGEIGLLFDLPRTASVIAHTRCTLLVLTKPDLDAAAELFPDLKVQLHQEAERRLEMSRRWRRDSGRNNGAPSLSGERKGPASEISLSSDGADQAFRTPAQDAGDVSDASDYEDFQGVASYTSTTTQAPPLYAVTTAASPPFTADAVLPDMFRRRGSSIADRGQVAAPNQFAPSLHSPGLSSFPSASTLARINKEGTSSPTSAPLETDVQGRMSPRSGWFVDASGATASTRPTVVRAAGDVAAEDADVDVEPTIVSSRHDGPRSKMDAGTPPGGFMDTEPLDAAGAPVTGGRAQVHRELRERGTLLSQSSGGSVDGRISKVCPKTEGTERGTSPPPDGGERVGLSSARPEGHPVAPLSPKSSVAAAGRRSESPVLPAFRDRGLGPRRASVAVWADPALEEQLKKVAEEHAGTKRHRSGLGRGFADAGSVTASDDDRDTASISGESITFTSDDEAGLDDEPVSGREACVDDVEVENLEDNTKALNAAAESSHFDEELARQWDQGVAPSAESANHVISPKHVAVSRPPVTPPAKQPSLTGSGSPLLSRTRTPGREAMRLTPAAGSPRPHLLSLPPVVLVEILSMLPLISLVAFRRVSRDCLAFLEAHPSQLVPVSLDLSPFHKRIDDDTLISILVTWVLPGLKSSYEAGADGTSCSSATVAPSPPLSANFHSAALRAPGRSEAPRRPLGLSLRNCWSLTNRGIATLGPALPHLRFLDIQGCWDASGPGLASLRNAPGLRSIDLSNCRKIDTAAILALMAGCPNIEDIRLGYCKGLTGDIFAGGRATWCRVKRLNLQRCTGIWDAGFAHWAPAVPSPAPALADVGGEEDAGAPEADAEAEAEMEVFAPGGNSPREEPWAMEELILSDCSFLTDASITSIAASCSNLRRFSLSFCCALTEAAAGVLANGMPNLTALDLSFCGMAVSDSSLRKLARGLRKLEALGLRGCNRVTEAGLSAVVLSAEEGAAQPPPPPGAAAPDEPEAAAAAAPEQKQRYHFLSLRSLNASQCKDVSPAALSRMAAASRGRWSVTTRPIVDLQQPVAFYGDGSR